MTEAGSQVGDGDGIARCGNEQRGFGRAGDDAKDRRHAATPQLRLLTREERHRLPTISGRVRHATAHSSLHAMTVNGEYVWLNRAPDDPRTLFRLETRLGEQAEWPQELELIAAPADDHEGCTIPYTPLPPCRAMLA